MRTAIQPRGTVFSDVAVQTVYGWARLGIGDWGLGIRIKGWAVYRPVKSFLVSQYIYSFLYSFIAQHSSFSDSSVQSSNIWNCRSKQCSVMP
jgi:hypothetical protein